MDLHLLRRHVRAHHVVVRSDLVPETISRSAWSRAHEIGALTAVHRGISRLTDAPVTFEQRAFAATMACGDGAVAAGTTAARLWGVGLASDVIHVIVPRRTRTPRHPGIVVHRPTDVEDLDVTMKSKVRVTGAQRTVLDVAAWSPDQTRDVIDHLAVARRIKPATLGPFLARHEGRGRRDVGIVRRIVDDWSLGLRPPDSALEATMGELLRRYALPTADFQAPVGRYRPDFLWPTEMVILECDGWGTHGRDRAVFERDRERDAWLHAAGYVVWRFTWMQISQRQAWVADRIGCGLAVRRVQLGLGADLGVVIPE